MGILKGKVRWYSAGLAFECARCGRCCAGPQEGYVWVTKQKIAAIARLLEMPEGQLRRRYVRRVGRRHSLIEQEGSNDCIFLVSDGQGGRTCRVYEARPRQCRTWPFWPINLTGPADWALAQLRCPGINRGCLYSYDEIETSRQATQ